VILPTILLLPGADEDSLARLGFSIPRHVQLRDVALPAHGRRQQAQVGRVAALPAARAARGRAKDHDVLDHRPGNPQREAQPAVVVAHGELPNGARVEHHRLGWLQQYLPANARPCAVDPGEMVYPKKRTPAQTRMAQYLCPRDDPRPPLFRCQHLAPRLRHGAQRPPRARCRACAAEGGNDVPACVLAFTGSVEDNVAAPPTFGNIKYLHIVLSLNCVAAPTGDLKPPACAVGRLITISLPTICLIIPQDSAGANPSSAPATHHITAQLQFQWQTARGHDK
jgi:hypothetical protein